MILSDGAYPYGAVGTHLHPSGGVARLTITSVVHERTLGIDAITTAVTLNADQLVTLSEALLDLACRIRDVKDGV